MFLSTVFAVWRGSLEDVRGWLVQRRAEPGFAAKAFTFFFAMNLACFWAAVLTAYPYKLHGMKGVEYMLISLPVSALGAVLGLISLSITAWAIDRALATRTSAGFLAFLSLDLMKAVFATFWVVATFLVSGWLVAQVLPINESLADRVVMYERRIVRALTHPLAWQSVKNLYVGAIMGASAMIPTIVHLLAALWAFARAAASPALSRR